MAGRHLRVPVSLDNGPTGGTCDTTAYAPSDCVARPLLYPQSSCGLVRREVAIAVVDQHWQYAGVLETFSRIFWSLHNF